MTDEIHERYQDQFCTIRRRVGSFNWADPSEKSSRVKVVLPEYGFSHEFKFDQNFPVVEKMPWDEAIDVIVGERPRLVGDRESHRQLEEILDDNREEIHERWRQHRISELEDELETIRTE
jgi:hypothetical protein